jgi:hypothetical protein
MKKFRHILFTVILSIIIIPIIYAISLGLWDPLIDTGEKDSIQFLQNLKGIGNLFLLIVLGVFSLTTFSLFFYIPFVIYLSLRKGEDDGKQVIQVGKVYAIIFGGLSILAIAGSLLRELH